MKRILLVDDDESLLEALKLLFEDRGYQVYTSVDGDIVEELEKLDPDLILLDFRLPRENGGMIAKKIKAKSSTKDIPILLVSANNSLGTLARECGVEGYLEKPFDIEKLMNRVERYLS